MERLTEKQIWANYFAELLRFSGQKEAAEIVGRHGSLKVSEESHPWVAEIKKNGRYVTSQGEIGCK